MKTCPICKSHCFDDMPVCYGCLYDFEREAMKDGNPPDAPFSGKNVPCAASRPTEASSPADVTARLDRMGVLAEDDGAAEGACMPSPRSVSTSRASAARNGSMPWIALEVPAGCRLVLKVEPAGA